jgi:hypothetical protein
MFDGFGKRLVTAFVSLVLHSILVGAGVLAYMHYTKTKEVPVVRELKLEIEKYKKMVDSHYSEINEIAGINPNSKNYSQAACRGRKTASGCNPRPEPAPVACNPHAEAAKKIAELEAQNHKLKISLAETQNALYELQNLNARVKSNR